MNVSELTMTASQINTREIIYPKEIFLFIAVVYFVLCSLIALLANRLARTRSAEGKVPSAARARFSLRVLRLSVSPQFSFSGFRARRL